MNPAHIFLSHASADDAVVQQLREALEARSLRVWVDSRNLRGSDELWPEIAAIIGTARQFIVLFSENSMKSGWVSREVQHALAVESKRRTDDYRVIPLLLDGFPPGNLNWVFQTERIFIPLTSQPGGVAEAMTKILEAFGERLPNDAPPVVPVPDKPVAELLLRFRRPHILESEGKRRATAEAELVYEPPPGSTESAITSDPFTFTAPLGPIETEEMRWYLEKYVIWPDRFADQRAQEIRAKFTVWGRSLFDASAGAAEAAEALAAWREKSDGAQLRFSVLVESRLPKDAGDDARNEANEAASLLLALPWELLHDGRTYLFQGKHPVRVRRRLPNQFKQPEVARALPIRVLLVSPRPEDEFAAYIDHRISARPLVAALESLGDLVELTVLRSPNFPAMQQELKRADDAGTPYHVVHFDGHGVYDPRVGLGKLCFEKPDQDDRLEGRETETIDAEKLAAEMRERRIPLVFLEACQSAKTDDDPTASVAAKLLEQGVVSVVAMTHSVLIETARRFVAAFYAEVARGARVGAAMLAGQQALHADTRRGVMMGAGEFHLEDWFVPVLYQDRHDLPLVTKLLSEQARQGVAEQRKARLGELPEAPPHNFIGRSRELLKLERLLHRHPYAVVRGVGGEGKTTLAAELARWLAATRRFHRAAFVSLEEYSDARGLLDSIGRQVVGANYTAATYGASEAGTKEALLPVLRELESQPVILVIDNVESVLDRCGTGSVSDPPLTEMSAAEAQVADAPRTASAIFALCQALLDAHPATRIVFTSREPLPAPFDHRACRVELGALDPAEAVELVCQVMKREGLEPKPDERGYLPEHVHDLVEAANRHARALWLLAREIARAGVAVTTENLRHLMADLERRHPGDRENSLFASVELSLRRLPPESRQQANALAVFHGGAHQAVLGMMLELQPEAAWQLAGALIEVGLAEEMDYGHLRLDPALPAYLLGQTSVEEAEQMRARWAEAMATQTGFLYEQRSQDTHLAASLTPLELPNLMAMLQWIESREAPERVVDLAQQVERLLAKLGRPQELAQAAGLRERAARSLPEWSHARHLAESAKIDRMLERGDLAAARAAAESLLRRALAAGESAFPEAVFGLAMAHFDLGRVLMSREPDGALLLLAEAEHRFEALGKEGEKMASAAITKSADCLAGLGRLEEAAARYEEAIQRDETRGDKRDVVAGKGQFGSVRLRQRRYDDALALYEEARTIFTALGEPRNVAGLWHLIAIVYRKIQQYDLAEQAHRQSLAIRVQQNIPADEAATWNELGNLYDAMGRLEDAVNAYRRAAEIHVRLQDRFSEGSTCSNLAYTLIKLQRHDEARAELRRAIEFRAPFGHNAEMWMTWEILHRLEQATGNAQAAREARWRAMENYLAYRRDGGYSRSSLTQLYAATTDALQSQQTAELAAALLQASAQVTKRWKQIVLAKLQAILGGDRDPALADDPELDYDDAVELRLLLESIGQKEH